MRRVFAAVLRWGVVPFLLLMGIITGGADGVVGWLVLGWMLFRGGPGMWADVRRFMSWGRGRGVLSMMRGRRSAGSELNA